MPSFLDLEKEYLEYKKNYNLGINDIFHLQQIGLLSLCLLEQEKRITRENRNCLSYLGMEKRYFVFKNENDYSRPFRDDLFIQDSQEYLTLWGKGKKDGLLSLGFSSLNSLFYTVIASFSSLYDLYKKNSNTPGTMFEMMIGTLLSDATGLDRTKHIILPNYRQRVTTDIVLTNGERKFVIPTKITTRERISQAWIHQKILDDIFGLNFYNSFLVCMSETHQHKGYIDELCSPGQIILYQNHVSKLSGIYYFDIPYQYMREEISSLLTIKTFGEFIFSDARAMKKVIQSMS